MNAKLQLVGDRRATVDLARLARMPPDELRRLHQALFGRDLPFANAEQTRRKIAFKVQADREGGLPESARKHALGLAKTAGVRLRVRSGIRRQRALANASVSAIVYDRDPRLPMPGSVVVKEYRGRTIVVRVLDSAFEYDGRRFTSLTAVATEITGTKWNGLAFFGLTRAHGR